MRLISYDCEVFAYDWLVTLKDKEIGVYTCIWNDNEALKMALSDDCIYVGFNSKHYDQYIIKAIDTELFELGDIISFTLTTGEKVKAKAIRETPNGMLFITVDCLKDEQKMFENPGRAEKVDYEHSDLRKKLNGEIFESFPEEIKGRMVGTRVGQTNCFDKLWSAYTNDLKSRKKEGAKEIHIATRWSVHDVIGRLENQYGGDSRAKFIVLPALDADGESNFNYTYGVGFSRHYFEDMRNNLDEASFKALFMNQPIEREGLLYDVDELRRYFELPAEDPDAIIGICDTKDKGSDYAFLPAAYVYGNDYYIDDCICDNSLPNIVDARLVDILLRCKVKMCRFESNSAGGRVAEKVQNEVKKRGGITRITTKFTTANKETKIIVNSAWVKEHCLFKDDSLYKRQSDYGRMMDMLGSYTVAGKNKHDDVPDGMAMLAEFAQSLSGARVEVFQRPW